MNESACHCPKEVLLSYCKSVISPQKPMMKTNNNKANKEARQTDVVN